MKRFALFTLGTCLISLGSGCCCLSHGNPCSPCGPAGCGVNQGYPVGTVYNANGAIQAAAVPTAGVTIAQAPGTTYQNVAMRPLSTY